MWDAVKEDSGPEATAPCFRPFPNWNPSAQTCARTHSFPRLSRNCVFPFLSPRFSLAC